MVVGAVGLVKNDNGKKNYSLKKLKIPTSLVIYYTPVREVFYIYDICARVKKEKRKHETSRLSLSVLSSARDMIQCRYVTSIVQPLRFAFYVFRVSRY